MMQIGSVVPAHHLHLFQAKPAAFKCSGSPLNPVLRRRSSGAGQKVKASLAASTEVTRNHLTNLDKLLQKQSEPTPPDPRPAVNEPSSTSPENKGRSFLEGLSLPRIWPEMKAAEEMSPRHLNRLQRLLSKSPEYSPRNNLGSRWREYHGCNDWAGLLDPLDENLRREMVRYGEFIQAAYHCFHSNPGTPADRPPSPRHVALPDRSYRVTKSLYVTSSIGLPKWVDDVAPDLGWMTQRSSWIGYVAVCDDRREIQRMGRRDIVIALRGTATCLEWAENVREGLVDAPPGQNEPASQRQAKVECGFLSLYQTQGAHVQSLAQTVVEEVQKLIEQYKGETLSITVTGHSLGAALALLVANDVSTCAPDAPPVAVFSFGGPRVGNRGFANLVNENNVKVLRIVNSQDVITRMPGMLMNETLDKKLRESGATVRMLNALDNNMYSHVGTELRIDTKMSPYLRPNADVACCHDLEAYLHLVDGFSASDCPFRPNAKRSLVRLLNEQRSNIKKLYTTKAKGLTLNLEGGHGHANVHHHHHEYPRPHLSTPTCLPSPS